MTKSEKQKAKEYLERQIKHFEEEYSRRGQPDSKCVYKLLLCLQNSAYVVNEFLHFNGVITYEEWEQNCDRIFLDNKLQLPMRCEANCNAKTEEGLCKYEIPPFNGSGNGKE